jgi:DNA-binding NarL/FixJ family response regulator
MDVDLRPMKRVAVAVLATDPVTGEGTIALISSHPQLTMVGAARCDAADVLLVLAEEVTEDALVRMECASRHGDRTAPARIVLVANSIEEHQLRRAIDVGLASLLPRRETGIGRIVDAVVAAGAGRAPLPGTRPHTLLAQLRSTGPDLPGQDCCALVGLATREVDVLRLLSDGLDTTEVAVQLNYSERTVKNIIRGVLERCGLRNRTHAVAFALRRGVL